jgi:dissimilatory sulfite reductase (desulfoviridin) alpha/beta subunit
LIASVAGCPAGQGQDCGVFEHADLTFQGRRRVYPEIDQELAALSPKLARLVANCPGKALSRPAKPNLALEINESDCRRCGWCVSEDLALSWPQPQGGYFRLILSGRKSGPVRTYLPPKVVWDPLPGDLAIAFEAIFALVDLWLLEARTKEAFLEFLERTEKIEEFSRLANNASANQNLAN